MISPHYVVARGGQPPSDGELSVGPSGIRMKCPACACVLELKFSDGFTVHGSERAPDVEPKTACRNCGSVFQVTGGGTQWYRRNTP